MAPMAMTKSGLSTSLLSHVSTCNFTLHNALLTDCFNDRVCLLFVVNQIYHCIIHWGVYGTNNKI